VLVPVAILSGWDMRLEGSIVSRMPEDWSDLTTQFQATPRTLKLQFEIMASLRASYQ